MKVDSQIGMKHFQLYLRPKYFFKNFISNRIYINFCWFKSDFQKISLRKKWPQWTGVQFWNSPLNDDPLPYMAMLQDFYGKVKRFTEIL